jgi:hypothetical protein
MTATTQPSLAAVTASPSSRTEKASVHSAAVLLRMVLEVTLV